MSNSSFVNDLQARIQEAEGIIANQNESLAALRHLLRKEMGESVPNGLTLPTITPPPVPEPRKPLGIDFTGKQGEIVLALVKQSGENGTRPGDIAAILVEHKLIKKGSNAIHTHLSELKKKGLVKQKAEGLYIASSKPAAAGPVAATTIPTKKVQKKRTMSAEAREAISKAQKARWAAANKAKG